MEGGGLKNFTALGCYIFAGGFTIGMKKHLNVQAHFEEWEFGTATAKKNHKIPIHIGVDDWPINKYKPDVIYGNPPCAAWSPVGKSLTNGMNSWRTDSRVQCTNNLFRLLEIMRPKIWIWESVPRVFTVGKDFVKQLEKKAITMGYSITYFLTDAQLYGLPQRRQRFHMIIHKVKLDIQKPPMRIITTKQTIDKVKNKWFSRCTEKDVYLIKNTKPGKGLRDTFERLMPMKKNSRGQISGRPIFINFRLHPNKPSPTLIGGNHAAHYSKNRFLTPIEHAMLCGYPENYKWDGEPQTWYKQAGQSVTSVMGDVLGKICVDALTKDKKTKGEIQIIDYRKMAKEIK